MAFSRIKTHIVFLCLMLATAILNMRICKPSSHILTMKEYAISRPQRSVSESTRQVRHSQKELKIILAKTVSVNDVGDTIRDIETMTEKYSGQFQLQWKLFCYQNQTFNSLRQRYDEHHWKQAFNTDLYMWEGRNKINFWYKYLNPQQIPSDVDFIWMMDGDIRLRNMAWSCFWDMVKKFRPAVVAPAIMSSLDAESEKRKLYTGSTHPGHCYNESFSQPLENDFEKLVAMDVWVIEIQVPVFTRGAWEVVYKVFSEQVPGWGDFRSMWGPDLFWCKLVDHHLLNITDTDEDRLEDRPSMMWDDAKESCSLDESVKYKLEGNDAQVYYYDEDAEKHFPHPCMIIHATPVEHLDTKTIDSYNKGPNKVGPRDVEQYHKALPQFLARTERAHRRLFRAYVSEKETEYQCQACKHVGCLSENR